MISCTVEGLDDFRADLSRASRELPRAAEEAQQRAGERVLLPAVVSDAPQRARKLAGSYRIETRGGETRGRWSSGYRGSAPRFAGRVLEEKSDELAAAIGEDLEEPLSIFGWFR